jgi:adenosylcobinamide-GDP ribazoletransferase
LLTDLRTALAFLTRLPLPASSAGTFDLARAGWAFPLVGAVVGLAGWVALWGAAALGLPAMAGALLAIAAMVWLTGALHEDGLADSADGLGARGDRARRLEVMRDSRTGAFGVLALVLAVGLRVAALAALTSNPASGDQVLWALVAAHALARGTLPATMAWLAPARADGLAAGAGRPGTTTALVALLISAVIAIAALGLARGVATLAIAAVAIFLWCRLSADRFGGHTGDTLGAQAVLGEIVVLLAAAARP